MFDFLSMMGNYEQRKVDNFQGNDIEGNKLTIDTAEVSDANYDYETAVSHLWFKDGSWCIVEQYETKEESQIGHDKWVKLLTTQEMPDKLLDIPAGFEDYMGDGEYVDKIKQ